MVKDKDATGLPVFKVVQDEWFNLFNDETVKDVNNKKYRRVGTFLAEEPGDETDGVGSVHVIMDEDGQYFGYFYFGMYNGETEIEYNGESFGIDGEYDDPDSYFGFYVYERVRELVIKGYTRV